MNIILKVILAVYKFFVLVYALYISVLIVFDERVSDTSREKKGKQWQPTRAHRQWCLEPAPA